MKPLTPQSTVLEAQRYVIERLLIARSTGLTIEITSPAPAAETIVKYRNWAGRLHHLDWRHVSILLPDTEEQRTTLGYFRKELSRMGIQFDTGAGMGYIDWSLDWSFQFDPARLMHAEASTAILRQALTQDGTTVAVQRTIENLNQLFDLSPNAVRALMDVQVECSQAAEDFYIGVYVKDPLPAKERPRLNVITLINVVLARFTGHRIACEYHATPEGSEPQFKGFCVYHNPTKEPEEHA